MHGSGFETLVEFFERGPVFRILVVDLAGHSGPILGNLLVPKRNEKGCETLPFLGGKCFDLGLDFLNAHGCIMDEVKVFATIRRRRFQPCGPESPARRRTSAAAGGIDHGAAGSSRSTRQKRRGPIAPPAWVKTSGSPVPALVSTGAQSFRVAPDQSR